MSEIKTESKTEPKAMHERASTNPCIRLLGLENVSTLLHESLNLIDALSKSTTTSMISVGGGIGLLEAEILRTRPADQNKLQIINVDPKPTTYGYNGDYTGTADRMVTLPPKYGCVEDIPIDEKKGCDVLFLNWGFPTNGRPSKYETFNDYGDTSHTMEMDYIKAVRPPFIIVIADLSGTGGGNAFIHLLKKWNIYCEAELDGVDKKIQDEIDELVMHYKPIIDFRKHITKDALFGMPYHHTFLLLARKSKNKKLNMYPKAHAGKKKLFGGVFNKFLKDADDAYKKSISLKKPDVPKKNSFPEMNELIEFMNSPLFKLVMNTPLKYSD